MITIKYYRKNVSDYDKQSIIILRRACYNFFIPLRVMTVGISYIVKILLVTSFDFAAHSTPLFPK